MRKSFERKTSTHGMPVSEAGGSYEKSMANLGGNISDPFIVFDEVKELYKNRLSEKSKTAADWKKKKMNGQVATVPSTRSFTTFTREYFLKLTTKQFSKKKV